MDVGRIRDAVDRKKQEVIELVRELVKTPSPTGKEGDVAELLRQRMKAEGFTQASIDPAGNAIGIVKGGGKGRSLLFNGHMDHVSPGDMEDPYSAELIDGARFGVGGQVIYGRGASDMKGAVGAMLMAGAILKDLNITLEGDLMVGATVLEEDPGNIGPPYLIEVDKLQPDTALVGEPTNLDITYGNRGVVRTRLATYGRSCHVGVQERGVNALYKMTGVIRRIEETTGSLPFHPVLGRASWAVCKVKLSPNVVNVVPDRCEVEVDTRSIPGFGPDAVIDRQRELLHGLESLDPSFKAEVSFIERDVTSWTGYRARAKSIALPFFISPDHWFIELGKENAKLALGVEPRLKVWGFTTEAFCFAERGIPTIGFGPGEERFTHSREEALPVEDLIAATKFYATLAASICG